MRARTAVLAALLLQFATELLAPQAGAAPASQVPLPSRQLPTQLPIPIPRPPLPVPPPAGITAYLTPISATLSWPAVGGATGYLVARSNVTSGPYGTLTPNPIAQTSFTDPGVVPSTAYTYIVTAIAADGHQAGSAPVTFTTPPPTNPNGLAATVQIGGVVELHWPPVAGVSDYSIETIYGSQILAVNTVPATVTQFFDFPLNVRAGYAYSVYANFRGTAGTFSDRKTASAQAHVVLNGLPQHVPWLTRSDPYADNDPTGAKHSAEANQYLNTIGTFPNKATLGQWMQANGFVGRSPSRFLQPLRAVYFNAGDLNLGRDMRCQQTGQTVACMVSNFAPPVNHFAADTPDVQTALAGAVQGAHSAIGYLATVAMEVSLANPSDVKFYVYAGTNDAASTVAVLDTEANAQTHLPAGYSPFNCITCHGGSYDTTSHTVKGSSFLPFDVYSFKYSQQPGFTQADQEEVLRQLNALVKSTRPNVPAGTDPIATFIDGMYAGNVNTPGAKANDTWVPVGWMTPAPAGQNVYNAIIKPFCRTCHLAISGDLSFPSYLKFRNPAINPNNGQPLGGQRDQIQAALCGGNMPQAEVPSRKFWQNPNISWMGYLQDPSVAGMKCN